MRPVNPALAAFGEKCAGVFWKDMPQHHNIATELSILNAGKGDPESLHYVLPAKRTQEPRMLTRLFSSPRGHYNAVRSALDYHRIYDPSTRAAVGGEVLRNVWPTIYKPLEKKPDFNRPTDLFEHYYAELEKKKKKKPAKEKKANFWQDYAHNFNKLYNPESYGFDVRTPTGRDDLRNIAVSTAVGTGIGAVRGAIWPGYIEKMDEAGRVISKKKRGRLLGSLRDAMLSGALSGVSSAAGITAKKYMPEIEQALNTAKENVISNLPLKTKVLHEGVDVNTPALDRVIGAA
jgi:hypothetical protein